MTSSGEVSNVCECIMWHLQQKTGRVRGDGV